VTAEDGIRAHDMGDTRQCNTSQVKRRLSTPCCNLIADRPPRSAAASRICANPQSGQSAATAARRSYKLFLSMISPHHQMKIMATPAWSSSLNGLDSAAFLKGIAEQFSVRRAPHRSSRPNPMSSASICRASGTAWKFALISSAADPVARLDVSLLQNHLIRRCLASAIRAATSASTSRWIRGLAELEKRSTAAKWPQPSPVRTSMEDLMAVADAGEVMPPKSTWFEPKLADGLCRTRGLMPEKTPPRGIRAWWPWTWIPPLITVETLDEIADLAAIRNRWHQSRQPPCAASRSARADPSCCAVQGLDQSLLQASTTSGEAQPRAEQLIAEIKRSSLKPCSFRWLDLFYRRPESPGWAWITQSPTRLKSWMAS